MKQWLLRVIRKCIPRTLTNVKKESIKTETDVLVLLERYGSPYDDTLKGNKDEL